MPEGYLHLTCEQRCQIYALLQSGHSQAHIARQIGVDPSTIDRTVARAAQTLGRVTSLLAEPFPRIRMRGAFGARQRFSFGCSGIVRQL